MSKNEHFPDPYLSEPEEDEFIGADIHDEVGGSPAVDAAGFSDRGTKKPIFFVAGGLAIVILIAVLARFVTGGGKEDAKPKNPDEVKAQAEQVVNKDPLENLNELAKPATSSTGGKEPTSSGLVNTAQVRTEAEEAAAAAAAGQAGVPGGDLFGDAPVDVPGLGGPDGSGDPSAPIFVPGLVDEKSLTSGKSPAGEAGAPVDGSLAVGAGANPFPATPAIDPAQVEAERIAAAEEARAQAELKKQLEREAREKAKELERERLRKGKTMMASAGELGKAAAMDDLSKAVNGEGTEAEQLMAILNATQSAAAGTPGVSPGAAAGQLAPNVGDGTTGVKYDILPGTKIEAVTISEYRSDAGSRIELRLNQPLRDRQRRVVLPAGSRAFGTAAGKYSVGTGGVVKVSINVFVTPDGRVVKDLSAFATDPETLSDGVKGGVDHHYPSRIARGSVATVLDLALTSKSQPRSIYQEPSQRELAIADARSRLNELFQSGVGDESSLTPTVILPQNANVHLVFGL